MPKRGRDGAEIRPGAAGSGGGKPAALTPSAFHTLPLPKPSHAVIQSIVMRLIFGAEQASKQHGRYLGRQPRLPGPLAIGLDKQAIHTHVLTSEYELCEKSDGERRMLLALPSDHASGLSGVFLLNRSFVPEQIPQAETYREMLAPAGSGPTLLDGELLLHTPQELQEELRSGRAGRVLSGMAGETPASRAGAAPVGATYLMFDVVTLRGRDEGGKDYRQRQRALGQARLWYKEAAHAFTKTGGAALPLLLMSKTFMPRSKVKHILQHIQKLTLTSSNRAVKVYSEGSRCNLNDGVVLTPVDVTYRQLLRQAGAVATAPLLKWKWLDDITIDFAIRAADFPGVPVPGQPHLVQLPLHLHVNGSQHTRVTQATLPAAQAAQMEASAGQSDPLIVECAHSGGTWVVVRRRPDKNIANHTKVGWHSMELLAEGLSDTRLVELLGTGNRAGVAQGQAVPPTAAAAAAGAQASGKGGAAHG